MERIPPHSDEAERSVLGACMLSKDALFEVAPKLHRSDFYNKNLGEIYDAIVSLEAKNAPVDLLTVCEELKMRGALDIVGGRAFVAELSADIPSVENAGEYADIVARKAEIRKLIAAAGRILESGYSDDMPAKDILDRAEQEIFSIAQNGQTRELEPLKDVLMENMKQISLRAQQKGEFTGVPTGLIDFDRMTSGLQKSDLVILAARPSMGKTSFSLCVARNAAVKGYKVAIFSLEMSRYQISQRLLSMESAIDLKNLSTGKLQSDDWQRISAVMDNLTEAKLFIDDTVGISLMEMKNKCRRLKKEEGLDLIIVDYLQLMEMPGSESRQQEISAISRALKQLAREMDCPVVALSQLSRASETRTDHRPILSDLRDSGAIEQDADLVLFLYRDEVYNEDTPTPGECEIIVAKHRNGPTGVARVRWQSQYAKFVNLGSLDAGR